MKISILKTYLAIIGFLAGVTKSRRLLSYKIFIAGIIIALLSSCASSKKKQKYDNSCHFLLNPDKAKQEIPMAHNNDSNHDRL